MYLSHLSLRNFRQFGDSDDKLELPLSSGVTALVGRNDSGKSAVIDAIRYALLTRDLNYIRVQPEDFHIDASGAQADEIFIRCRLSDLNDDEKGAFAEYLTYDGADVSLIVNWAARRRSESPSARRWVDIGARRNFLNFLVVGCWAGEGSLAQASSRDDRRRSVPFWQGNPSDELRWRVGRAKLCNRTLVT